ncbi:MAG: ester cyclase [Candidatus Nanopelagicales bacterium]|nr:ester cyclase [Candidatus Nanopelagicales bacterium]MCF8538615.1 ester cyclase [Candidatus Nanopelagicales bacterium]MCF8541990.1 ester cyclase [Candidatus Nanopelagicales bacterium]
MNETETAEAIKAYLDALNAHDPDAIAACVTEDFHNEHTSALGSSVHGRAAYRERLVGFLAAFTDLNYEVEDLLLDGVRAVVAYRMTFCVTGSDGALRPVAIRGVFRFAVRDGLVAHRVDYWDGLEYQRQLEEPA